MNAKKDKFARKHLLAFVDNEGAQCSILRGRSSDGVLNAISHEVALLEDSLGNIAWYSRVPSASNPAVARRKKVDAPSRLRRVPWLTEGKRVALDRTAWKLPVLS